jgi:exosortase A
MKKAISFLSRLSSLGPEHWMSLPSVSLGPGHGISFSSSWRHSFTILCSFSLFLILFYWSTATRIVAQWETATFSYGFLILPIGACLVWLERKDVASENPCPTFWAIPVLAGCAVGWMLGRLTATDVVQQFCFVAMLIVFLWGMLGTPVTRKLIMPLSFLLFAVPLGSGLIPKLQDFAAWFAVRLLELCKVPVLLEGRFISIPSGSWEVAEACSGVRYLASSMGVGFLFAGLAYRSWIRRTTFFVASAVVPVLANGFRVFGIILLAYLSGNRIAAGVDHLVYGWVFFTLVASFLLAFGFWWREKPQNKLASSSLQENKRHFEARASSIRATQGVSTRSNFFATISLVIIGSAPLAARSARSRPPTLVRIALPAVSSPWHASAEDNLYKWQPSFVAPDAKLLQSFASQSEEVKLYVACYSPARLDAKLISSGNKLFDEGLWKRTGEEQDIVTLGARSVRVRTTFIRSAHHSLAVLNWYWVDGNYTGNDLFAKVLLAKSRLSRRGHVAAAIAVALEDDTTQERRAEVLKDFLEHVSLEDSLRSTED